jgi:hypothetical protein
MKELIKKTVKKILNEAHINAFGELQDMDFTASSDDLWDDNKFREMVQNLLDESITEMPKKMYVLLSDNHKEIYIDELLNNFIFILTDSENDELLNDVFSKHTKKLEEKSFEWIEQFSSFGNDHFPFSSNFIKRADEIFQGRIINKFIEFMDYLLTLTKTQFNSFNNNIKRLILKNNDIFKI